MTQELPGLESNRGYGIILALGRDALLIWLRPFVDENDYAGEVRFGGFVQRLREEIAEDTIFKG